MSEDERAKFNQDEKPGLGQTEDEDVEGHRTAVRGAEEPADEADAEAQRGATDRPSL